MTTQQVELGKQEGRRVSCEMLRKTRLAVGRPALFKEEDEGEGFCGWRAHEIPTPHLNPLPLVKGRSGADVDQRKGAQ